MFATNGDYPPKSPLSKGDFENRVDSIVGWVEVTKPFGYAVPALRLPFDESRGERSVTASSKGRATPNKPSKLVLGFAIAQPNLQILIKLFYL